VSSRQSTLCLQDLDGPLTHGTGIIFLSTDPLCDIAQLRLGQPAVSKTIAQLEDRLGARLPMALGSCRHNADRESKGNRRPRHARGHH
jgi:hypothetical protein